MPRAKLPESLTNCIADSQVDVMSWSADAGELVLRITKDVGPETGMLRIVGVSYVHLPPRFETAGIAACDGPSPDYPRLKLDSDEIAIAFHDPEDRVHLVVAESVDYVIDKQP